MAVKEVKPTHRVAYGEGTLIAWLMIGGEEQ